MPQAASLAVQFQPGISGRARPLTLSDRDSRRTFAGIMVMLFIVSTAITILWCNSMTAMSGMPMPGGWTMSMTWMRMPGQTWAAAASSFLGMWVVMMVAMMLPSLAPALDRYRQSLARRPEIRRGRLTALAGLGYFFVWALFGLAVFLAGVALANIEMEQPAVARVVPVTVGLVILLAGALQFTRWKAHHLVCCREALDQSRTWPAADGTAWKLGMRFGLHCSLSCANLTAILLVIGVMDLRAMLAVTAAVTAERLAPGGERVARAIGAIAITAGCTMVIRTFPFA
jgi:predicted metal-binding membrane protein